MRLRRALALAQSTALDAEGVQHELSLLHARAVAIEALPTRTVARSEMADAAAEPVECSICLGDLAVGDAVTQPRATPNPNTQPSAPTSLSVSPLGALP